MSIQHIEHSKCPGVQARVHIGQGKRLTQFFGYKAYGGKRRATALAKEAELKLKADSWWRFW